MLLRSSSTPVLGSLLPSVPESPNNNHYETPKHQSHNNIPFHYSGSQHLSSYSSNSSPSVHEDFTHKGFRRAQSEGNIQALAYASCGQDENQSIKKLSGKPPKCSTLETIPSFSVHNLNHGDEEEEEEEEEDSDFKSDVEGGFALRNQMSGANARNEVRIKERSWLMGIEEKVDEMYLAKGLGIDFGVSGFGGGGGGGNGGECYLRGFGADGGDDYSDVEEFYKSMVEENPGNPLFLRNYAQFLYQTKHDLQGAEEYYSRAILADPGDGEILANYAKLVWELHRDQDRASNYFERAVQASPADSHVHAAYASFLWDIDDEDDDNEDGENVRKDLSATSPQFHRGHIASVRA